jgi:hypothetical protein
MPDLASVASTSHGPLAIGLAIAGAAVVAIVAALAIVSSRRGCRPIAVVLAVSATVGGLFADGRLGHQGASVVVVAGLLALAAMGFHFALVELGAFDPPAPSSLLDSGKIVMEVDYRDRAKR